MQLQTLHIISLLAASVAAIVLVSARWVQGIAITEFVLSLLWLLSDRGFLRVPIDGVDLWLAGLAGLGWAAVLFVSRQKAVTATSAIALWIATIHLFLETGWVRVDLLHRLLQRF
ncbi:MAG: hypothetical protein D6761_10480 [Candidatus Dadabacteria bacterium]|nr:MAG: hypothetical protein D6761_10480 [Candidatus Dadabacteria bacterium]